MTTSINLQTAKELLDDIVFEFIENGNDNKNTISLSKDRIKEIHTLILKATSERD